MVRIGLHWGPVLTDGVQCTGDAVNLSARVATSAKGGEIRLTREAFLEITTVEVRLSCRSLPPAELKGLSRPVEMLVLNWRDHSVFPATVTVEETGEEITLLIVEHDLDFVMRASDRVVVMNDGRVITQGSPDEVRTDERVVDAYLGARHEVA